jgi:hypothetical protein
VAVFIITIITAVLASTASAEQQIFNQLGVDKVRGLRRAD